jgi:hypothetical protein
MIPLCLSSLAPSIRRGLIPPANFAVLATSPLWAGARTLSRSKPNPRKRAAEISAQLANLGFQPVPDPDDDYAGILTLSHPD